jgi:hypothetical protein
MDDDAVSGRWPAEDAEQRRLGPVEPYDAADPAVILEGQDKDASLRAPPYQDCTGPGLADPAGCPFQQGKHQQGYHRQVPMTRLA